MNGVLTALDIDSFYRRGFRAFVDIDDKDSDVGQDPPLARKEVND